MIRTSYQRRYCAKVHCKITDAGAIRSLTASVAACITNGRSSMRMRKTDNGRLLPLLAYARAAAEAADESDVRGARSAP